MKSTHHDALMCLLLHQQRRLTDPSLNTIAMPRECMEVLRVSRLMNFDGIKVTPETMSLHPEGGEKLASYVAAMLERTPVNAPMEMLVEAIRKENTRATISSICIKYQDEANDDLVDPSETLLGLQAAVTSATAKRSGVTMEHGGNMKGVYDRIEWRQKNPGKLRGPSIGFRRIDERINGLTPRFYIIGARPSVGKSALASNVIEAVANEKLRCVLFGWEMPADDYRERLLSSLSGVNITAFSDRPLTMQEINALSKAERIIKGWDFHINDDPDTTIEDVEAQSMMLHQEQPITLIVVDYIQLIRIKRMGNRQEEVSEISNRLLRLRRRLKTTAILALSQLRRVEGRFDKTLDRTLSPKPELSDLRESGNLEQDADFVGLLHRDPRHEPESAELIIAKQRGGATGEPIKLDFKKEITRFKESPNQ